MSSVKKIAILHISLLCGASLYADENATPVQAEKVAAPTAVVAGRVQQAREKREALLQRLESLSQSLIETGIVTNQELTLIADEIRQLESRVDKKLANNLRTVRLHLEDSRNKYVKSEEREELAALLKNVQRRFKADEQLFYSCDDSSKCKIGKACRFLFPALTFVLGAGIVALLHYNKIIELPLKK